MSEIAFQGFHRYETVPPNNITTYAQNTPRLVISLILAPEAQPHGLAQV